MIHKSYAYSIKMQIEGLLPMANTTGCSTSSRLGGELVCWLSRVSVQLSSYMSMFAASCIQTNKSTVKYLVSCHSYKENDTSN